MSHSNWVAELGGELHLPMARLGASTLCFGTKPSLQSATPFWGQDEGKVMTLGSEKQEPRPPCGVEEGPPSSAATQLGTSTTPRRTSGVPTELTPATLADYPTSHTHRCVLLIHSLSCLTLTAHKGKERTPQFTDGETGAHRRRVSRPHMGDTVRT